MRKYLDANIIANTKDMPKDEWLKKRKCGIGGSDASSILGFNPYKSSMAVYLDKIDDEIRFAHVANGSKGEPVAQNCYANLLGDSKERPLLKISMLIRRVAQKKRLMFKIAIFKAKKLKKMKFATLTS